MINLRKELSFGPLTKCYGDVMVEGSKSISNRVLLLAALADTTTEIRNILFSEDTEQMMAALQDLGVVVEVKSKKSLGGIVSVAGCGGIFPNKEASLFLGNAGTAFRPLTAVLALRGGRYSLSGVPRMHQRPIGDLINALRSCGADLKYVQKEGFPPIEIFPGEIKCPSKLQVSGKTSSQFLSSMLMAVPLLKRNMSLEVVDDLISKPYINITLDLMARFGVSVKVRDGNIFDVNGSEGYTSPKIFNVEPDVSNATYFFAAGVLGDGPVNVLGIGKDSIQGDIKMLKIIQSLGADVTRNRGAITIRKQGAERLKAFDLDLSDIPDAAMTLAVIAIFCDGKSYLRNIGSWRVKETDRISAMATELRKLGADVEELKDELHISPPAPENIPERVEFTTYDDHRMAMGLSLSAFLGIRVTLQKPECVQKTFPSFFERFLQICDRTPIVITIDGPAGSGKGTAAKILARKLGFNYLDSGVIYRILALACKEFDTPINKEAQVSRVASSLDLQITRNGIVWRGRIVGDEIRTNSISQIASKLAKMPTVREKLVGLQRRCVKGTGLVAEGRDMGTVIFPMAYLKVYLNASLSTRALRRYKQLIEKGLDANLDTITEEIRLRDKRDIGRKHAPLLQSSDSKTIDSSNKTPREVVDQILIWFREG